MANRNPEASVFDNDRRNYMSATETSVFTPQFVRNKRGWILFGPQDIRGRDKTFTFCLQQLPGQKSPRVRAGCRYYTLKQAYNHWSRKVKYSCYTNRKNEGRQALAIIQLMLLQAQAYGLISLYAKPIKFDRTVLKPKRK